MINLWDYKIITFTFLVYFVTLLLRSFLFYGGTVVLVEDQKLS